MTGKNEHKIAWLRRYENALRKKERLQEDLTEYITSFAMCKSPVITDMPSGSHDDAGLEKYFPKMEEYERDINAQIDECMRIRDEISEAINAIGNISGINKEDAEKYMGVLTYRYKNSWKWEEVAKKMHVSCDHARGKLHGEALEALKIPKVNTPEHI